jgi:Protein of unknown function (DUF998)
MAHIARRTSALAGLMLGPVWIGVVIVVTWLEWDFLHSLGWGLVDNKEVPYPSATARGDFGYLQMLNFAVTALLVATFAVGFRREFRRKISGLVATAGFALASLGLLLNVCQTDLPGEPSTWHGSAHGIGFAIFLLSIPIAFGASGLALRDNPSWRGWRLLGWTPVVLLAIAFTSVGLPGDVSFYVFLVVVFGWYTAMGARLLALDSAVGNHRVASPVPEAAAPGLL